MQEHQRSTTTSGTAPAERRERDRGGADESRRDAGAAVREVANEAGRKVQEEAGRRGREIKARAEEKAQRWSSRAGQEVETLARALRTAGDALGDDGQEQMARWSRRAAREVERMGGYLKEEDPGAMLRDLEDLARRNPATFLGTTFAAGLAAGRFLRSSEPSGDERSSETESSTGGALPAPTGSTPGAVEPARPPGATTPTGAPGAPSPSGETGAGARRTGPPRGTTSGPASGSGTARGSSQEGHSSNEGER